MRRPRIEVYRIVRQDLSTEWRWRLVAGNGEIVAQSEGYTEHHSAARAARAVRRWARLAKIETV